MINIAVIDDGINEKSFNLGHLEYNVEITTELEIRDRKEYTPDEISHGSICARIIRKYSPDAVLSSVKILNGRSRCGRHQLVKAIKWCADNAIKILNLSLGTIDIRDFPAISQAVNEAYKKGMIIIAAANNSNVFTYPASHTNVIGVKADMMQSLGYSEYIFHDYPIDGIDITACGTHLFMRGSKEQKVLGSSYAAPLITALVCNYLHDHPEADLDEIKETLRKGAINCPEGKSGIFYKNIDWVDHAILFSPATQKKSGFYPLSKINIDGHVCLGAGHFQEFQDSVLEYLYRRNNKLKNTDTVILEMVGSSLSIPAEEAGLLMGKIADTGKNIIFLDDNAILDLNNFRKEAENVKVWHPWAYKTLYIQNEIYHPYNMEYDAAFIVLYDMTGNRFIHAVRRLINLFRVNGYNAIGATDTCTGILYELEYMPIIPDPTYNKGIIPVEMLKKVYSPDLILFGTDFRHPNPAIFNYISNNIKPYAQIIIAESFDSRVQTMLSDNDGSKKIVILSQECGNIGERYRQAKFFNANKGDCYHLVYKHIMDV